jgi:hypothetical protein
MRFAGWLAMLALVLTTAAARAQDLAIDSFVGKWRGIALSENKATASAGQTPSMRSLTATITKDTGGGFSIAWGSTEQSREGRARPEVRESTLTFVSTGANAWRSKEMPDPAAGKYAWATLRRNVLQVNILEFRPDGGWELQTYGRTLTKDGLQLRYVRFKDGLQSRTVRGTLNLAK